MCPSQPDSEPRAWQLAAESIVVKIRWFGIVMGYVLVQSRTGLQDANALRGILALGAGYALLDTHFHRRGQVFLGSWPLFVAVMESTFIALLCYFDSGLNSPFRWYYLLSAICCAIRYRPVIAWLTLLIQLLSLLGLGVILHANEPPSDDLALPLTFVVVAWATWAAAALAEILKATGRRLEQANDELERHHVELEARIAEQVEALRATQAKFIHQEKMAAFGLLSAGIAHEVGNPLAALSSLIQMLRRRRPDDYTDTKLELAEKQLGRIRRTIGELVDFSRPASTATTVFRLDEAVTEALEIAKYYHRTKDRRIVTEVSPELPRIRAVRDHLIQVVLNLLLNAIDATGKDGLIRLEAENVRERGLIRLSLQDDGRGLSASDQASVFQPHFTTKPQGTGLGLFISRRMVAEMGGRLTFESELHVGTTFTVELPAAENVPAMTCVETTP